VQRSTHSTARHAYHTMQRSRLHAWGTAMAPACCGSL
jgi:hypothetical protein